MNVFEKIEAQQAKLKDTEPAWMVGMQLKDICRADPGCAEIVSQDLENPDMSLEKAANQIHTYANKNHGKACQFCVTPKVAEGILRSFYGLPDVATAVPEPQQEQLKEQPADFIDLLSIL